MRTATRLSLWTLLAVIPVGCAALVVTRRRRTADDFEAWWRSRQRLRDQLDHAMPSNDGARRDDLFV
jgi:hypothetical protein